MEAGDLVEVDGVRYVVVRVNRTVAELRNATEDGLRVPADSPATVIANPPRDWVYVPIKLVRGVVRSVRRPLPGGLMQTLVPYAAWIAAGAGVYVAPSVRLGRGDVLHVDVDGKVQQVRIKSLDPLGRRVQKARAAPAQKPQPETIFDRLMQDDDD